jgi:hypothetical protein
MFVPKYVLKRLVPEDGLKIVGETVVLNVVNVITPIPFSQIPGEILDILEIKLDDEVVISSTKRDLAKKMTIKWNNQTYSIERIKDVGDGTLPVGDKFEISMPNAKKWKKGEKHSLELTIKIDSPISIKIERTVA